MKSLATITGSNASATFSCSRASLATATNFGADDNPESNILSVAHILFVALDNVGAQ
jgi:hypothetical protein